MEDIFETVAAIDSFVLTVYCPSMPDGPFNVLNDSSASSTPLTEEPKTPTKGIFSPPGVGHMFQDGFQIPDSLSGKPGDVITDDLIEEIEENEDVGTLEPAKVGGPAVPGFDGALSKTPADVINDKDYSPIPAVTSETLICMVGPCRHYTELVLGVEKPKDDPFDRPDLWRICRLLHDSDGEVSLKDANVTDCSGYKPPLFSIAGQVRKVRSLQRLDSFSNRKAGAITRLTSRCFLAAGHLRKAAKTLLTGRE